MPDVVDLQEGKRILELAGYPTGQVQGAVEDQAVDSTTKLESFVAGARREFEPVIREVFADPKQKRLLATIPRQFDTFDARKMPTFGTYATNYPAEIAGNVQRSLMGALNEEHYRLLEDQVKRDIELKRVVDANPISGGFGAGVGSMLDPIQLGSVMFGVGVAAKAVRLTDIFAKALKVGIPVAITQSFSEVALSASDVTRTESESRANIAGALIFGGLIGGGSGVYDVSKVRHAARVVERAIKNGDIPKDEVPGALLEALEAGAFRGAFRGKNLSAATNEMSKYLSAAAEKYAELPDKNVFDKLAKSFFGFSPFGRSLRSPYQAVTFLGQLLSDSPVLIKRAAGARHIRSVETEMQMRANDYAMEQALPVSRIYDKLVHERSDFKGFGNVIDRRRNFNEAISRAVINGGVSDVEDVGVKAMVEEAAVITRKWKDRIRDQDLKNGSLQPWELIDNEPYWHRVWNRVALNGSSDEFIKMVARIRMAKNKDLTLAEATETARENFLSIMGGSPGSQKFLAAGRASHNIERTLNDIPTRDLIPYLEMDSQRVLSDMTRTSAARNALIESLKDMVQLRAMDGLAEQTHALTKRIDEVMDRLKAIREIEEQTGYKQEKGDIPEERSELEIEAQDLAEKVQDMQAAQVSKSHLGGIDATDSGDIGIAHELNFEANQGLKEKHRAEMRAAEAEAKKLEEEFTSLRTQRDENEAIIAQMKDLYNSLPHEIRESMAREFEGEYFGHNIKQLEERRDQRKLLAKQAGRVSRIIERLEARRLPVDMDLKLKAAEKFKQQKTAKIKEDEAAYIAKRDRVAQRLARRHPTSKDRGLQPLGEAQDVVGGKAERKAAVRKLKASIREKAANITKDRLRRLDKLVQRMIEKPGEISNRSTRRAITMRGRAKEISNKIKNLNEIIEVLEHKRGVQMRAMVKANRGDPVVREFTNAFQLLANGATSLKFRKTALMLDGYIKGLQKRTKDSVSFGGPAGRAPLQKAFEEYGRHLPAKVEEREAKLLALSNAKNKFHEAKQRLAVSQQALDSMREEAHKINPARVNKRYTADARGRDLASQLRGLVGDLRRGAASDSYNLTPFLNDRGIINRQYLEQISKAKTEKQKKSLLRTRDRNRADIQAMLERLIGHSSVGDHGMNRAISTVAKANFITYMGLFALSSANDLVSGVGQVGFMPIAKSFIETMRHPIKNFLAYAAKPENLLQAQRDREFLIAWGMAKEQAGGQLSRANSILDIPEAQMLNPVENIVDAAHRVALKSFLVGGQTSLSRGVNARAFLSQIYTDGRRYLSGDPKWAFLGKKFEAIRMNRDELENVIRLYEEFGDVGNRWLKSPNSHLWTGEGSTEGLESLKRGLENSLRQSTPTPSVGDKPRFMSNPLMALVRQFTSFAAGAHNRIFIPALQQRDMRIASMATAQIVLALGQGLSKDLALGNPMPENPKDYLDKAINNTPLFGYLGMFYSETDRLIGKDVEALFGHGRGANAMDRARAIASLFGGPAGSTAMTGLEIGHDTLTGRPTERTINNANRFLFAPLRGAAYANWVFRMIEHEAAKAAGLPLNRER